jgi:hypothetical protein
MDVNRYCAMPTFGRGIIRKFNSNASSMKCLAARYFEDLLQVSVGSKFLNMVADDLVLFIVHASCLRWLIAR